MRSIAPALLITTAASVLACGDAEPDQPEPVTTMPTVHINDVTDAQWQDLGARRIFFGHQSVGRNILDGVQRVLDENPDIRLRIVGSENPASVEGPALIESAIGQNTKPSTKADAFARALETGFGSEPGAVAMYKYCYVDMQPDTDPDALFADYVRRTDAIHEQYPGLTVVHFTLPLHAVRGGWLERLQTRFGRSTQLLLGLKRNRYNALLRQKYAGREPVFDLADLESTRADGSKAYVDYRGQRVFVLAPEWTTDGGHLNEEAQVRIAERLLVFLTQLPADADSRSSLNEAGSH